MKRCGQELERVDVMPNRRVRDKSWGSTSWGDLTLGQYATFGSQETLDGRWSRKRCEDEDFGTFVSKKGNNRTPDGRN